MLCKHQSVFVNTRKSHWIFNNLATESVQQTMVSGAKDRVLEDEFGGTSLAILSLLLYYWRLSSALFISLISFRTRDDLTEFEDGQDKSHFPLPEGIVAGMGEDASGAEDDHLVDGVLLYGMVDFAAGTAPVAWSQAVSVEGQTC
jgi:hypothetical protein